MPHRGGRQQQLRYGQDFDRNGKGKGKTKTKTMGRSSLGETQAVGDRAPMATRLRRGHRAGFIVGIVAAEDCAVRPGRKERAEGVGIARAV